MPNDGIALTTYCETSRTYDWRSFDGEGNERWVAVHPAGGYASPALAADGSHLVGPVGGTAWIALDADDGRERWRVPHRGFIRSTPVHVHGAWTVASGGSLCGFANGRVLRERSVSAHLFYGRTVLAGGFAVALGVRRQSGDRTDGVAIAFDPSSLEVQWERSLGRDLLAACDTSGPAVDQDRDRVVVTSHDGVVQALRTDDGQVAWRTQVTDEAGCPLTVVRSAPSIHDGSIAVGSLEGYVTVLDAEDGSIRWSRLVESFGVWSPPLWHRDALVVHAGSFLVGLDSLTGDRRWSVAIGFDGYTAPTPHGGRVVVCGGDPPLDGYLLWIDPKCTVESPAVEAECVPGHARDALRLSVVPSLAAVSVEADLRPLGGSARERFVPTPRGWFLWEGLVPPNKRYAETVIFGSVVDGQHRHMFSAVVDTGASARPSVGSARTLESGELPRDQRTRTSSGPTVVAALAHVHGRQLDCDALEDAARYMRRRGDVPIAHMWRGGAVRLFMASRFPLLEEEGREPDGSDVRAVVRDWRVGDSDGQQPW